MCITEKLGEEEFHSKKSKVEIPLMNFYVGVKVIWVTGDNIQPDFEKLPDI